ncbi:MAG: zinc dependent phospholipase C family protein [Caulobacteraceae bacterium]
MPALLTHCLCGSNMLKRLEDGPGKDIILKHIKVFNLGTQGPDIMFFHAQWPWEKKRGLGEVGNTMHEKKTGEFFSSAFDYVINADPIEKELLTVYMCGYACHYSLDCHAHPYIFYKSGFLKKNGEFTLKYSLYHRMFETALDVLTLSQLTGKKPADVKPAEYIKVSPQDALVIGRMYETVLKKVYDIDINSEEVSRAISDMTGITAALHDKSGIKKKLLSYIEKSIGKLPLMSSMILPGEIDDGIDYLNLSHAPWYLPWDKSAKYTSSFLEMFEAAIIESKKMCNEIFKGIIQKNEVKDILKIMGNLSFSTGVDCNSDTEFKYYDCVYEKNHA